LRTVLIGTTVSKIVYEPDQISISDGNE